MNRLILAFFIAFCMFSVNKLSAQTEDCGVEKGIGIDPPNPSSSICTQCYGGKNDGIYSTILGLTCTVTGQQSLASGNNSTAAGDYATALGKNCIANGISSFAVGNNAQALGSYTVALGQNVTAPVYNGVAIGINSEASMRSVSLGDNVNTLSSCFAFGRDLDAAVGASMVIGRGAGFDAKLRNTVENSIMMGCKSSVPTFFIGPAPSDGETGNVGIATTEPVEKLDVNGNVNVQGKLLVAEGLYNSNSQHDMLLANGTSLQSGAGIVLHGSASGTKAGAVNIHASGEKGEILLTNQNMTVLTIKPDNAVWVGTKTVTANMLVNGLVKAREIKVDLDDWADYVFDEQYVLMPLNELEHYVKRNRHLPDVPSQTEVVNEGVELGAMNKVLLQKVEELTLYIIQQQNEQQRQREEIEQLKQMIKQQR